MIGPAIAKGRFTNLGSNDWRDFSLNPTTIRDSKGASIPTFTIPGLSDPAIQWGSGSERTISFVLRLDSDIGYRNRRTAKNPQVPDPKYVADTGGVPQSVTDEIMWYRQFLYAEGNARLGLPEAQAPVILFTFGSLYQNVRCLMRQCDVEVLQWTPRLEPVRADLSITLVEQMFISTNRSSIYDPSRNKVF